MNGGSVPFDCTDGSLAEHYTSIQGLMLQFPADQPPNIAALAANNIGGNTASTSSNSAPSRYESQKRRDWNTFGQYLKNHRPPLALAKCSGAHVLEFLRYLDQFGKTKVHMQGCLYFGQPQPPAACACPLRQAWGSLDALIGRLRAAFEENGGKPESNPFGARAVRLYLREVREMQAKARGIAYEKKKRRRPPGATPPALSSSCSITATPLANNIMTTSAATSPPGLLQGHILSPDRHRQASCSLPSELSYHPHLPPSLHMQLHREDGCLTPHVISQHSSLIQPDHQLPYRHHPEEISDTFPSFASCGHSEP